MTIFHVQYQLLPFSIQPDFEGGCEYNGHLKLVESYDMYRKRWVRSSLTTFQFPRAYHACIKFGKELYTIGGCNDVEQFNYTDRFNLDDQKCVQVASSFERRCYVGCARIDSDKLIAVGGYNGYERLAAAEIFHVSTNEWQRIRDMNTRRSDGHCVLLNDDVYAVCGFDGVNIHSTVEFYSAKQNRWINVPECMHKRRSGVGAVAIGGVIFVCGGFDGTYRLSSSEFLDPREGQWHYLTPMRQKRSNFGIELFNYEIVVAGGYRGQPGVTNFVEAFDFRANAWYELPSMNTRRSGLNLISLEDHDVIRQFLTCSSYAH